MEEFHLRSQTAPVGTDTGSCEEPRIPATDPSAEPAPKRRRVAEPDSGSESEGDGPVEELDTLPDPTGPAPDAAPVDPFRRRKLQVIIKAYKLRFGDRLDGVEWGSAEGMSVEDLENMLVDIRFLMQCNAPGSIPRMIADLGVNVWEKAGLEVLQLPVQGTAIALSRDKYWNDLVDEWCLEHAEVAAVSVEARIGLHLLQTTHMVYTMNTNLANAAPEDRRPVEPQTVTRWKDL